MALRPRGGAARRNSPVDEGPAAGASGVSGGAVDGVVWALVLGRWVAAQVVIARIEPVRWVAGALTAAGILLLGATFFAEPNWPWVLAGGGALGLGIGVGLAVAAAVWALRRLSVARRARPLRDELERSKGRLLAELSGAGVPVSLWQALRFVAALATGRRPQRGVASKLRAVVSDIDSVLDRDRLRAAVAAGSAGPDAAQSASRCQPEPARRRCAVRQAEQPRRCQPDRRLRRSRRCAVRQAEQPRRCQPDRRSRLRRRRSNVTTASR